MTPSQSTPRFGAGLTYAGSRAGYSCEYPQVGVRAFICEMPEIVRYPDGQADVELLPVARCVLTRVWGKRLALP